ncbi:MAG: glycerol-3-phosphate acyltransferase [Chloroflexi bacterium]|nr:glycerol-3-phosphate acyltransferase [Chloroflexota bacterium]
MIADMALIFGAYLYGSIPFIWALARRRQVNLRIHGSRNVGGSNLWQTVGPREGLLGGLGDASKGVVPVVVGRAFGFSPAVVALAGLAGAAGQCWPLYLKFFGGRGISACLGVMLVLAPGTMGLAAIPMVTGAIRHLLIRFRSSRGQPFRERLRLAGPPTRSIPLGVFIGFTLLPFIAWARGEPWTTILAAVGVFLIMAIRRLTADLRQDLHEAPSRRTILINRFLFDRSYRQGYQ